MVEKRAAHRLAGAMLRQGVIPREQFAVCAYGFEVLLSSLIGLSLIFLIALSAGRLTLAFMFLAGFVPVRIFAGGYHARTHVGCYLVLCAAFMACRLFAAVLPLSILTCLVPCLLILGAVSLFAPVEAANKRLKPSLQKMCRVASCILCLVDLIYLGMLRFLKIPITPEVQTFFLSKAVLAAFLLCPVAAAWLHKQRTTQKGEYL